MAVAVKHGAVRRMRASRSKSSTGPAGLHQRFEQATRALALNFDGVIAGEIEAVHQFRISIRRLRGLIDVCEPLLEPNRYREQLKSLGRSIGALRDTDVLQQNLTDAAAKLDDSARDALPPLHEMLAERRSRQHEQVGALLKSPRCEELVRAIAAASFKPSARGEMDLPELITPLVHKVQRTGARLHKSSSVVEFHRLRVKLKRLRYALESFDGAGKMSAQRARKALKKAQAILGIQHDLVTAIAWLRELATSDIISRQTLFAAGAIYQVLHRRSIKVSRRAWRRTKAIRSSAVLDDAVRGVAGEAAAMSHEDNGA